MPSGLRLVLVITGKGRPGDARGARAAPARHPAPQPAALAGGAAAGRRQVLQVAPAHQRHGGGGAYYVYLRRSVDPDRLTAAGAGRELAGMSTHDAEIDARNENDPRSG